MCGRYQLEIRDIKGFKNRFDIDGDIPDIETSYNMAPGQDLPVVVSHSPNSLELMEWGLIPFWEQKKESPKGLINIRSEKAVSASWAKKYIQFQRCIVPASGFYEWQRSKEGTKPYRIYSEDDEYLAFAGLYAEYQSRRTYAILTTEPNELMRPIHNRMPMILTKEEEAEWLNPDNVEIDHLKRLLDPYEGKLQAYPISTEVNSPRNNDPKIIKPM